MAAPGGGGPIQAIIDINWMARTLRYTEVIPPCAEPIPQKKGGSLARTAPSLDAAFDQKRTRAATKKSRPSTSYTPG